MTAKNKVGGGETDPLIGKTATIVQGNIRNENEWSGVRITDVSERAVTCEWTSRNIHYTDVIPWHSITQISIRSQQPGDAPTEPKTP